MEIVYAIGLAILGFVLLVLAAAALAHLRVYRPGRDMVREKVTVPLDQLSGADWG